MIKRYFVVFAAVLLFVTGFGTNTAKAASTADQVISAANSQLGTPYRWGGTTSSGFDCSGLVQYAFAKAGIYLPRTVASQYKEGTAVSRSNLQPGDIVFFVTTSGPSHDGIYIGNNQFIHSSSSYGVSVSSLSNVYWGPRYIGAKRVIPSGVTKQDIISTNVTVELNGAPLVSDQGPIIMNSTTLVPLRAIFEALDAHVEWHHDERMVTGGRNGTTISLTIGSKTAYVNGKPLTLLEAPVIRNSRTLVPLRFISESLGADVDWDPVTRKVTIID